MKTEEFQRLKHAALERRYSRMNDMQKMAVFQAKGPLLILAGAGSGKTTVLVNRIAYLLSFGNAYHDTGAPVSDEALERLRNAGEDCDEKTLRELLGAQPVKPWNVLAITFTNKAAGEIKARLESQLGEDGKRVNAGTFHSVCVRILRREIEALGYGQNFTIYDTDDSLRTLRDVLGELRMEEKVFPAKAMLHAVSRAKDAMISPEEFKRQNQGDFRGEKIAEVYSLYQKRMKAANAVDFDDIICLTVELFQKFPDVLDHYQNLYQYILVDEYQDTNHAQYMLVSLLAGKYRNLCVVGDDDQSIYRFRGATIENILSFEKEFPGAKVVRLEQNYRSTQHILDAANSIIRNNSARKGKRLWTDNGQGEKVVSYRAPDETAEAQFVVKTIGEDVAAGRKFSDHAVLYRTNAQSASIERQMIRAGFPYRVVGGNKFFDRKEIRDVLAYFHVIVNPGDSVRLKRIINEPKRGIGDTTVKNVEDIAEQSGLSMFEVMRASEEYGLIAKKGGSLTEFVCLIDRLREISEMLPLDSLLDELMIRSGYREALKAQGREGESRLENVEELKSHLLRYAAESEAPTLGGFLEEVALYTDLDDVNASEDKVLLMTMHSAKGLEYPVVFVVGMEENLFPSYQSASSETELEEERRLAYVAVTRAKERLYVTNSAQRMIFGRTSRNLPSRFLKEIPEDQITVIDENIHAYGYMKRPERAKPVYHPEIEGTVGVRKSKSGTAIDFDEGDFVMHKVFGRGKVLSVTPMAGDYLVEVSFDTKGKKKIMASYVKLERLEE